MSSAATLTAITALAAELCDPHQHVEPIVDRDPADRSATVHLCPTAALRAAGRLWHG